MKKLENIVWPWYVKIFSKKECRIETNIILSPVMERNPSDKIRYAKVQELSPVPVKNKGGLETRFFIKAVNAGYYMIDHGPMHTSSKPHPIRSDHKTTQFTVHNAFNDIIEYYDQFGQIYEWRFKEGVVSPIFIVASGMNYFEKRMYHDKK